MLQKIKALRTFAAGKIIFYPYAKEPYIVNVENANAWEKSGHCKLIGDPFKSGKGVDDTKVPEEPKKAVNEQIEGNDDEFIPPEQLKEDEIINFDTADYKTLKDLGKKAGIANYNTMKKPALIKALKGE